MKTFLILLLVTGIAAKAETIQLIYNLALENDQQFKSQEYSQKSTAQSLPQAYSYIQPSISLNASPSQRKTEFSDTTTTTTDYSINLSQSLYNAGTFIGLKLAKSTVSLADLQLEAARMNLISRVTNSYFNLMRSVIDYRSIVTQLQATQKQVEQVRQSYKIGLASQTDYFEAQSQLHQLEANRISLERNIKLARESIFLITNRYIDQINPLSETLTIFTNLPELDEFLTTTQQFNNQILQAKNAVKQAKLNEKLQKTSRYPTFNANVSVSDSDAPFNEGRQQMVSVNFSMPLYSGFRVTSEIKQAQYDRIQAEYNLAYIERSNLQSIKQQYLQFEHSTAQIDAYKTALQSAKLAYRATVGGYQSGTRTIIDVLNAEYLQHEAERNLFSSRIQVLQDYVNLYYNAGLLNVEHIVKVNAQLSPDSFNIQELMIQY